MSPNHHRLLTLSLISLAVQVIVSHADRFLLHTEDDGLFARLSRLLLCFGAGLAIIAAAFVRQRYDFSVVWRSAVIGCVFSTGLDLVEGGGEAEWPP